MVNNILLAEDDPNDVLLFEWAVKHSGLRPNLHVAVNGQDAIEYLKRCTHGMEPGGFPDMLVLDLKMPRVNGFEVLHWLAEQSGIPNISVVVLSGSSIPADMKRARELGALAYLEKPISPHVLRELLTQKVPA